MLANLLVAVLASVATASAIPTAQAATVAPDPSQVYLKGIAYGGTGCPQGTVGTYISADRQT